jgi:PIN domain nuclease of toxin-antitoxin system
VTRGEPAKYLLDTHTVIWGLRGPERLSNLALNAVLTGELFISVVSYWETTVKSMKGNIDPGDLPTWAGMALEQLNATVVLLRPAHVVGPSTLPAIHKDPFDRILIAQATVERLTLVSANADVARYCSQKLCVIGRLPSTSREGGAR